MVPIKDFDKVQVGDDAGAQFDRPGREPAGQVGNRSDQYILISMDRRAMASLKKQLEIESKSGADLGAGHSVCLQLTSQMSPKTILTA